MWEGENESSFLGASAPPHPLAFSLSPSLFRLISLVDSSRARSEILVKISLSLCLSLLSRFRPLDFSIALRRVPRKSKERMIEKEGERRDRGREDEARGIRGPSQSRPIPSKEKIKKANHEEGRERERKRKKKRKSTFASVRSHFHTASNRNARRYIARSTKLSCIRCTKKKCEIITICGSKNISEYVGKDVNGDVLYA